MIVETDTYFVLKDQSFYKKDIDMLRIFGMIVSFLKETRYVNE